MPHTKRGGWTWFRSKFRTTYKVHIHSQSSQNLDSYRENLKQKYPNLEIQVTKNTHGEPVQFLRITGRERLIKSLVAEIDADEDVWEYSEKI